MPIKMPTYFTRADVKGLKSRANKYNKLFYNSAVRLWRDAARAFLDATVRDGIIHVDTGMSAASTFPLARKANYYETIYSSVTGRSKSARKGVTNMDGSYDASRWKEIKEGERAGQKGTKLLFGSEKRPYFQFEFTINVYQYAYWEPTWNSLEIGMQAFVNYIHNNWDAYFPKGLNQALNPFYT